MIFASILPVQTLPPARTRTSRTTATKTSWVAVPWDSVWDLASLRRYAAGEHAARAISWVSVDRMMFEA